MGRLSTPNRRCNARRRKGSAHPKKNNRSWGVAVLNLCVACFAIHIQTATISALSGRRMRSVRGETVANRSITGRVYIFDLNAIDEPAYLY